jgi:hypothetical protein
MSPATNDLKRTVAQFVAACGRDYEFPAGGRIGLLTEPEEYLYASLQHKGRSDAERIQAMSVGLGWSECYSIVVFGVRLAVLAVRRFDTEAYRAGVLALIASSPKVDWRDVLGAFAIFENCGNRLGIDFQSELEAAVKHSDEAKLRSTMEGFFSRAEAMRSVDVMGLVESGAGDEFTFKSGGTWQVKRP